MAEKAYPVVIIGGGISGLACAHYLKQQNIDFLLIEKEGETGGWIKSFSKQGFLLELGPNSFTSSSKRLLELCKSLELGPLATNPIAKNRFIFYKNRLMAVPISLSGFFQTSLLSVKAKWQLFLEPFAPKRKINQTSMLDETVASWVKRRLGPEILNQLIAPFLTGIYAGNAEKLSAQSVFPKLTEWERRYGSILVGAISQLFRPKKNSKKSAMTLYNFKNGMQALPNAIIKSFSPNTICLNTCVDNLVFDETKAVWQINFTDKAVEAKYLILATSAFSAGNLINSINNKASAILKTIDYEGIRVVHVAIEFLMPEKNLAGFGFLKALHESPRLLGAIYSSSLYPERSPAGKELLTCFYGGALDPQTLELSQTEMHNQLFQDLNTIFPQLTPDLIEIIEDSVHCKAIPQYNVGHFQKIQTLKQALQELPLSLAGNYLEGIALEACIDSAYQAVAKIIPNTSK